MKRSERSERIASRAMWLLLLGAAGVSMAGCGDDDEPGAAADAATGDAGASADGDASSEAASEDATVSGDAADTGTEPEGEAASDAGAPRYGLFVGSTYGETAKLAVVNLAANAAVGTVLEVSSTYGDVTPYASGGRGFLMEAPDGRILALDEAEPWTVTQTIDVADGSDAEAGALPINPHAVVVTAAPKAYVVRYGSNIALVTDIATGKVTKRIDLSSFVAAGDPDGLVDAWDGAFDPATNRVYLLLQRIDQTKWGVDPDRVSQCLPAGPVVVAIDASTDEIIKLSGSDAGDRGFALLGQNSGALVPDFANGRLLVLQSGCYEAPDSGIDPDAGASYPAQAPWHRVLKLSDGTSTWLYEHAAADRLAGLIWVDGTHAFVERTDSGYQNHWYAWNPTGTTLGDEIAGFPAYGKVDQGRIVGLSTTILDAGSRLSVVAYDVGTGQVSTIVADPFGDTTLNAYGSAILR